MRGGSGPMGRGALCWSDRVPLCISLISRARSVWLAVYIHGIKGRAAGFDWTACWGRSMQYVVDGVVESLETGADYGRHANDMAVSALRQVRLLGLGQGVGVGLGLGLRVSSVSMGRRVGGGRGAGRDADCLFGRSPIFLSLVLLVLSGSLAVAGRMPRWRSPAAQRGLVTAGAYCPRYCKGKDWMGVQILPRISLLYFLVDNLTGSLQREGEVKKQDAPVIGRPQLRLQRSRGCRSKAGRAVV